MFLSYYIIFGIAIVIGLSVIAVSFIFRETIGKPMSRLVLFTGTLMTLAFVLMAFLFKK